MVLAPKSRSPPPSVIRPRREEPLCQVPAALQPRPSLLRYGSPFAGFTMLQGD